MGGEECLGVLVCELSLRALETFWWGNIDGASWGLLDLSPLRLVSTAGVGNHTAPTSRYWISMENMPPPLRYKGCFSCQAPVNETSNRYNSASPLKSSSCEAWVVAVSSSHTPNLPLDNPSLPHQQHPTIELGNSVIGMKMVCTPPANHILYCLVLFFLFSPLQNSVFSGDLGCGLPNRCVPVVMCVICPPDLRGPQCDSGHWRHSPSACWERWHHCRGMAYLFSELLASDAGRGLNSDSFFANWEPPQLLRAYQGCKGAVQQFLTPLMLMK